MKEKRTCRRPKPVDVLFFLGAGLAAAGIALWVCLGAGLVTAGGFCLAASWLSDPPGKDGDES